MVINGKPCKMVVDNCCRLFQNDTQFVSGEVGRHTLSSIKGSTLDIHFRKASLCIEGTSRNIVTQTLAGPIVEAPKSDNTVRICSDYMPTINQAVEDEPYVLPTTQDLSASLVGSKVFSKFDLSHACAQLNVDGESQEYLINTTDGVKSSQKYFRPKWTKFSKESGSVCVSRRIY